MTGFTTVDDKNKQKRRNFKMDFDIYFEDLNQDCQLRLLEALGREGENPGDVARDHNWDTIPLASAIVGEDEEDD